MAKIIQSKKQDGSAVDAKVFFAANSQRGDGTILVDSIKLKLTNLQKIYWPDKGYTKFDLLKYYYSISKDFPTLSQRSPTHS